MEVVCHSKAENNELDAREFRADKLTCISEFGLMSKKIEPLKNSKNRRTFSWRQMLEFNKNLEATLIFLKI